MVCNKSFPFLTWWLTNTFTCARELVSKVNFWKLCCYPRFIGRFIGNLFQHLIILFFFKSNQNYLINRVCFFLVCSQRIRRTYNSVSLPMACKGWYDSKALPVFLFCENTQNSGLFSPSMQELLFGSLDHSLSLLQISL